MSGTPFFSIIIPCFNSSKTIGKAIKSVIDQSFKDFEILIIDAVSTDDTVAIVHQFNEPRIKVYSEPDNGIYDAMNKGIALAKGEWLYFLGSDDYVFDNKVFDEVKVFILLNPACVVYGNVQINGSAGWARNGEVYAGEFDYDKLLKKNICHQSIFYNREFVLIHNFNFNLRYPVSADWDFNLRCWNKSKFAYLPQVIAVFQAGGLSTKKGVYEPFILERRKYWTFSMKLESLLKAFMKCIRSIFSSASLML